MLQHQGEEGSHPESYRLDDRHLALGWTLREIIKCMKFVFCISCLVPCFFSWRRQISALGKCRAFAGPLIASSSPCRGGGPPPGSSLCTECLSLLLSQCRGQTLLSLIPSWRMACCSELSKGMCILGETSRDDVLTQRHTPVLVELQMQRSVGLSPQILAGGRL